VNPDFLDNEVGEKILVL